MGFASHRVRVAALVVGLLALAGTLGVDGARAATIVLNLNEDGSLTVLVGSTQIRTSSAPGVVIPHGSYAAVINNDVPESRDTYHMFHLTGPGVNLQSDLLAGDDRAEPHTIVFLPNSTYVFQDTRNPQIGRIVFSTSATAAAVASSGSSGGSRSGPTVANQSPVGASVAPFRGTLTGKVARSGTMTLMFKGFRVSSLKAGRYKFTISDQTPTHAFLVQPKGQRPFTVTSRTFVGTRSLTLRLRVGKWTFHAGGKATAFTVFA
jgi:hypothetical protein